MADKNGTVLDIQQELKHIASGTGLVFFGSVFSSVVSVLYGAFIARVIGAEILGIYYLGLSIITFGVLLSNLGLDRGALRYVALLEAQQNFRSIKQIIKAILKIVATASVLLGLCIFILAKTIAIRLFREPELASLLQVLSLTIPLSTTSQILISSIRALHHIKYNIYIRSFLVPTLRFAVAASLLLVGWKLKGVIAAYLASISLTVALASYFLWRILWKCQLKREYVAKDAWMWEVLRFSLPLSLRSVFPAIAARISTWLLATFWSSESVAIYGVVARLANLGTLFLHSLNFVFSPMIAGLHGTQQTAKLEHLYKVSGRWIFTLSLPVYLLAILLGHSVLSLYGQAFALGTLSLLILCLGQIINSGTGLSGEMVLMSGRSKLSLLNEIIASILTAVVSVIFIPLWGITGAALAIASAVVSVNLIRLGEVYYFTRMHPYNADFLKPLLSGAISTMLLIMAIRWLPIFYPHDLWAYSITFVSVYLVWNIVFKISQEDMLIFQSVRKYLNRRWTDWRG